MLFSSAVALTLVAVCAAQEPAAVYDGGFGNGSNDTNGTIRLRIGNGGAGQSGLIKGTLWG
jgi:hypothetical protein